MDYNLIDLMRIVSSSLLEKRKIEKTKIHEKKVELQKTGAVLRAFKAMDVSCEDTETEISSLEREIKSHEDYINLLTIKIDAIEKYIGFIANPEVLKSEIEIVEKKYPITLE